MPLNTFARDGLRFDVRDAGPSSGEVVVCLHGFPQDATAYDAVTELLIAQGLRVLSFDQRGYSPGARPAESRSYVLRELALDVVALLDAGGVDAAHVVGHDWGGAVAWSVAGRHPTRVRSLTVLSTPHPAAMQRSFLRSAQGIRSAYMLPVMVPRLPELLAAAAGARTMRAVLELSGLSAERAGHYVARMSEPGALTGALSWYRAMRHSGGQGPGRVAVPTTYLWGVRDPFFAAHAVHATADYVTDSYRVVELPTGHWLPENRPQDVADAVMQAVTAGSDA